MKGKTRDMTSGSPAKLIVSFSLPLIGANVVRNLYTIVDAAIVGKGCGVSALASVGATDWSFWLFQWFVFGFAQGAGVLVAQYFGAGNNKSMREAASASVYLGLVVGVILTAAGMLAAPFFLRLLKTSADIYDGALSYLLIVYIGNAVILMYDIYASILRALGDSKSPLIASVIAGIMNLALDSLFVFVFHWGVVGAAAATVAAQLFSALYCRAVTRRFDALRLQPGDRRFRKATAKRLLALGIPLGLQYSIITIGGMVMQSVVNGYGQVYVAAFSATTKLHSLFESAAGAFGTAMNSYVGQNYGARRYDRIRSGVKSALIMSVVLSAVLTGTVLATGRSLLSLFISAGDASGAEVLAVGYRYLSTMTKFLLALFVLHICRNALIGMGDALVPMGSGVCELVARAFAALYLPALVAGGIFYAEPSAWVLAAAELAVGYAVVSRRKMRAAEWEKISD